MSLFDLRITANAATGPVSNDLDRTQCADTGRVAAEAARTWAGQEGWRLLSGFDARGCFSLEPEGAETLRFRRENEAAGWELAAAVPAGARPAPSVLEAGPLPFPALEPVLRSLQGFRYCAVRHPTTGLWKSLAGDIGDPSAALKLRVYVNLLRVLTAQGLPVGRTTLRSGRSLALGWRTPGKLVGCLHLDSTTSVATAAACVDLLLLHTASAPEPR